MDTIIRKRKQLSTIVLSVIITLISLFTFFANTSLADNHDVQDNAGILNKATQRYIYNVNQNKLAKIKGKPQLAVITVKNLDDYNGDIDEAGQTLFNKYQFGTKGYDNGVLLLISVEDHKVRMQTGYGMESVLPDAFFTNNVWTTKPRSKFKAGKYSAGTQMMVKTMTNRIVSHKALLRSKSEVNNHRAAMEAEQQKEQKQHQATMKILKNIAIGFISVLVLGGAGITIGKAINRYLKSKKQRECLQLQVDKINKVLSNSKVNIQLKNNEKLQKQLFHYFDPSQTTEFEQAESRTKLISLIHPFLILIALHKMMNLQNSELKSVNLFMAQMRDDLTNINIFKTFIEEVYGADYILFIQNEFPRYTYSTSKLIAISNYIQDYYTEMQNIQTWLQQKGTEKFDIIDKETSNSQYFKNAFIDLTNDEIQQAITENVTDIQQKYFVEFGFLKYQKILQQNDLVSSSVNDKAIKQAILKDYQRFSQSIILDDLNSLNEMHHAKKIDKAFEEACDKNGINDKEMKLDKHQKRYFKELTTSDKEDLLNSINFHDAVLAAMSAAVAVMIAQETAKTADDDWSSHSFYDGNDFFDDDDDDDNSFFGGNSSSNDDDFFDGFGGGGGFSGGGGADGSW